MPLSNLNAADLLRALADAGVSTTSDVGPYALAGMEPAAVAQPATVDELSAARRHVVSQLVAGFRLQE